MIYSYKPASKKIKEALLSVAKYNGLTVCEVYEESNGYPIFLFSPSGDEDKINVFGTCHEEGYTKVNLEEIMILLTSPKPVVIELTKQYSAVIDKVNEIVHVGCQSIPFDKIKEVYNAAFPAK
jgi:hypothetical protein